MTKPKITKSNLAVHNDNDKITISLSVLFGNVIEAENTHWSEKQKFFIEGVQKKVDKHFTSYLKKDWS